MQLNEALLLVLDVFEAVVDVETASDDERVAYGLVQALTAMLTQDEDKNNGLTDSLNFDEMAYLAENK